MKRLLLIVPFLFFYLINNAQIHERWDVKTITDGFSPNLNSVKKVTVSQLEPKMKVRIRNTQARLNFEKQVISITGTISRIALESDGDYHIEVTDGSMGDSTLVCEAVDPANSAVATSPMLSFFVSVRGLAKKLKVGDKVRFTGMLFQDKFHNPSAERIRNFLEIHPVLKAEKLN